MAFDAFLSIPGIPGEVTLTGFTNQIELYGYSLGVTEQVSITGGGGGTTGKPSFSDLSISKQYDRSSPLLLRALTTGTNIAPASGPGMVLSLVPASPSGAPRFLTYTFQDVYVSSVQDSGNSGGDTKPFQNISFTFGVIQETYHPQNPDGSLGGPISVYYNIETGRTG